MVYKRFEKSCLITICISLLILVLVMPAIVSGGSESKIGMHTLGKLAAIRIMINWYPVKDKDKKFLQIIDGITKDVIEDLSKCKCLDIDKK